MIEADYLREYGIRLPEVFYTMSWRQFIMLFSGLSKDSAFFTVFLNKEENKYEEDDPEQIAKLLKEAFF